MGCAGSRKDCSEEEAIQFLEESLRFQYIEATDIDIVFRKHSRLGIIDMEHLARISEELYLSLTHGAPQVNLLAFLETMQTENGEYRLEDWLMLGILLGKGSPIEKAQLLFRSFASATESVTIHKIKAVALKKMLKLSLNTACLVCENRSIPMRKQNIEEYLDFLLKAENRCINRVVDKLCADGIHINVMAFARFFGNYRGGSLMSTSGWREFLKGVASSLPTPDEAYREHGSEGEDV